jgi:hypothetical protein
MNLPESTWSYFEQGVVLVSLCVAVTIAKVAFKRTKFNLKDPFSASLTWDFTRSWASNTSALAGVIGVAVANSVTTDFKPFTHAPIKNAYTVTSVLMAAIVVAAPAIYAILQVRNANQLVRSVGGFLAASTMTIWGTVAQLLLQVALLIAFILEKVTYRFGLILVPILLVAGLIILIPYSINSIEAALKSQTAPITIKILTRVEAGFGTDHRTEVETQAETVSTQPVPRKLALL